MKQLHVFSIFGTARSFFNGQFKYLVEHGHEIILISSDDVKSKEFAERNNIKFVPVAIPRSLSPKAILLAIKEIRKVIKSESPESVFGHTPVGALVAMLAAKISGVRNRIYYRHGLIYTTMGGGKGLYSRLKRGLFPPYQLTLSM